MCRVRYFLLLLLTPLLLPCHAQTISFDEGNSTINMGNTGASHYRINGFNDPILSLQSGVTYTVNRTSGGHPLVFAYNDTAFPDAVTYSGNLKAGTAFRQSSVLQNGNPGWLFRVAPNGSSQFTFPADMEGKEVFYYCEISGHRGMIGRVIVEPPVTESVPPVITSLTFDGGTLTLAITGTPNTNFVVKSTTDLAGTAFLTTENTNPAVITTNNIGTASLTLDTAARPALFLRVEQAP